MKRRVKIVQIWRYPIKGCAGNPANHACVDQRGFRNDRRLMVVSEDGHMLSQRQCPALATIHCDQWDLANGMMFHDADGKAFYRAGPIEPFGQKMVTVWHDEVAALEFGGEVDAWFNQRLSISCCLVYMPDETRRPVNQDYGQPNDIVSFADGFPILLTTYASLRHLNNHLDVKIPMERFRANLVVDGDMEPFEEDRWTAITATDPDLHLRVVKPCTRCVVPTINQQSGKRDDTNAVFDTLMRIHNLGGKPIFGMNAIPDLQRDEFPVLKVGQTLLVEMSDDAG